MSTRRIFRARQTGFACVSWAASRRRLGRALPALCGLLLACQSDPPPPAPPPARPAEGPCPTGYSADPTQAELRAGIRAFRDGDYGGAQQQFSAQLARFPASSTLRVWLGDALLFDKTRSPSEGARRARPEYAAARALVERGCKLPRSPGYYLLMGEAYAALRLAKPEEATETGRAPAARGAAAAPDAGYVPEELDRASAALEQAAREYPTSAEVPYNQARVACARASLDPESPAHLGECRALLERALELSIGLERPRFLRTHRSAQDWIVRSRTQSEFELLRATSEYRTLVETALEASKAPQRVPMPAP